MNGSAGQTIVKYQGTTLPVQNVAVDLFNSSTAFPGGCFHLLGLQWFQFTVRFDSAGAATGKVTGEFSDDKGVTWVAFYDSSDAKAFASLYAKNVTAEDEVFVGMFKDVRMRFLVTAATADTTAFSANLALNPHKPVSKATLADTIGGNL